MAGLTDPTINPTITTTQQSQTTAPDWYNSYLSGITAAGNNAITAGGVAGASPLQTAAYNLAPTAINAGQPATNQAIQTATNVANTPTSSMIDQYMNPYTDQVVNSIGEMGTRNFNQLLAPAATSSAVGSGQFGSKRGMRVYGDVARDVASNITAQQAQARTTGFNNALAAAQNQQNLGLSAATTLGNLGGQTQTQATSGLNTLSTLGAQQQATDQARLNYPMEAQKNLAGIISGLNIPTGATQSATGPAGGGQMGLSPLSQIASLGASAGNFLSYPAASLGLKDAAGKPLAGSLGSYLGGLFTSNPYNVTPPSDSMDPNSPNFIGPIDPGYTGTPVSPDDARTEDDQIFYNEDLP
jgi:hypothetical protein